MEIAKFYHLCSQLSYKPGSEIRVDKTGFGFDITFCVLASDATKDPIKLVSESRTCSQVTKTMECTSYNLSRVARYLHLSEDKILELTEEQILNIFLTELIELERHEVLEFFKLNGVCVRAPHTDTPSILP